MSPCVGRTLYKTYKCVGRACEPFNERRLQQIYNWIHVRRVKYCLASLHYFETYFQNKFAKTKRYKVRNITCYVWKVRKYFRDYKTFPMRQRETRHS